MDSKKELIKKMIAGAKTYYPLCELHTAGDVIKLLQAIPPDTLVDGHFTIKLKIKNKEVKNMSTETYKVGDVVFAFDSQLKMVESKIVEVQTNIGKYRLASGDTVGAEQMTKDKTQVHAKMGEYKKNMANTKPKKPPRRKPLKRYR